MSFIYTALSVPTIASLKALTGLTTTRRVDGLFLAVVDAGSGLPGWYLYSSVTAAENLPSIVSCNDGVGHWRSFDPPPAAVAAIFGGIVICTSGCTISVGGSGKAFQFYNAQASLKLIIKPSFDISIETGSSAIALYRWSQEPNTSRTGQEATPVATVGQSGGEVTVNITSTYRWISVYAKNPANSNLLDGTCFVVDGNLITLLGYS